MQQFLEWLKGKKTHIVVITMMLVMFCNQMGWIDDELRKLLVGDNAGMLDAAAISTIREGLKRFPRLG